MRSSLATLTDKRADSGQHAGLLLHRYLSSEDANDDDRKAKERQAILKAAVTAATNQEVIALYKEAFNRWSASLTRSQDSPRDPKELAPSQVVDLQVAGRMIVGLGAENVLETGIRLHHTLGMPIIPGSALKGLAAHYCDSIWGERDSKTPSSEAGHFGGPRKQTGRNDRQAEPPGKYYQLIFGTTEDCGCVVFHDAWYVPGSSPRPLVLDVMTPHHPGWLDGSSPPTDFDSPRPVPFLSVTGKFRIAVAWRGPGHPDASKWTELALSLLKQALADWGVGGKTSSGYGRLVEPGRLVAPSESRIAARAQPTERPKSIPIITMEALKSRIAELGTGQRRLFKIEQIRGTGRYQAGRLRLATISAGFQSDGGWTVIDAPEGTTETYVIADCLENSKQARFVEVFGRLETAQADQTHRPRNAGSKPPRRGN
jgi:CRISPR type III-B/RAMP module RAMP protein Cmr6